MAITQFDTFLSIARNGSLSKAAAELYLTQPALTSRIHKFEAEVGTPLFTMSPTGARLTEAGEVLLPFVAEADERFKAGLRAVERHMAPNEKTVVFRYCDDELSGLLPHLMAFFEKNDVDLHVDYVRGDTEANLRAIIDCKADATFLAERRSDQRALDATLRSDFIFEDPFALMLRPDHPLAHGHPVLSDLAGRTVVVYEHRCFEAIVRRLEGFAAEGAPAVEIKRVRYCDEAVMLLGLHPDYAMLTAGSAHGLAESNGYVLAPLRDVEPLLAFVVTRRDGGPSLRKFVQVARLVYRGYGDLSQGTLSQQLPQE